MPNHKTHLDTIIHCLEENHASDTVALDVRDQTSITDYMIICSGRSSRQVRAIAEHLITTMKPLGLSALNTHGLESTDWALVDFGDYVIHIMQPDTRIFYNIEGLWRK